MHQTQLDEFMTGKNIWFDKSKKLMEVLLTWNVNSTQQINLIGLPEKTRGRHLQRYLENEALPETDETSERLRHLLGIADALRTSYPHSELMSAVWLNTPHRRFKNQKPIDVMIDQGIPGIILVREHLDCAFDWRSDEKARKNNRSEVTKR